MEFLVTTNTVVPVGTLDATVAGLQAGNAEYWRGLAGRGHLVRLWHPARPLNVWATIGLFAAQDDDEDPASNRSAIGQLCTRAGADQ